ncbi:MAG: hypothetical protein ACI4N4_01330 [Candidatus Fimenecus sp.]
MADDVKIEYIENKVNPDNLGGVLISEDAAESLIRCVLPDIVSFFQSEKGRKEFEKWDKDWNQLKKIK